MQGEKSLQIKNLTEEEFKANRATLVDIYFSAYQSMPMYAYDSRKRVKGYLNWLYEGNPEGFFIAVIGEEIVGFISCHKDWDEDEEGKVCEIHEFAVKNEYQGRGVGKALLRKAIEYSKSTNHSKVTLWVGEKNEKAINMYEKHDFKPLYKAGVWLRMAKDLKANV